MNPCPAQELANALHAVLSDSSSSTGSFGDIDAMARLKSDLAAAQQRYERAHAKAEARERETSSLKAQCRTAEADHRGEIYRLSRELEAVNRKCADMQQRHARFLHELRKKDLDFERLQVITALLCFNNNDYSKKINDA